MIKQCVDARDLLKEEMERRYKVLVAQIGGPIAYAIQAYIEAVITFHSAEDRS